MAAALVLASCAAPAAPARDPLAGVYHIGGGDAALANVRALVDAFVAKHPGVKFDIDTSLGSDPAVTLAANGSLDLGMVSRELTASDGGAVDHVLVGVAGTALVVHGTNPISTLNSSQVRDIYTGKVTEWSALGGQKQRIIPLVRETGSSARTAFESYIFAGKPSYAASVLEIQGGDQIRQAVAAQPGAIGIIGVTTDDPDGQGMRLVSIDGVAPTKQLLRDGTYKMRRPLYLVFGRTPEMRPAVAAFVEFIRGPQGQSIIDSF